jgi:hypothetical protein
MVGRGGINIFGFAPNARCFLCDTYTGDGWYLEEAIRILTENCQVISNSLVDSWEESTYESRVKELREQGQAYLDKGE